MRYQSMSKLVFGLLLFCLGSAYAATNLWVKDPSHLYRIDGSQAAIQESIELDHVVTMASTVSGALWALTNRDLQLWSTDNTGRSHKTLSIDLAKAGVSDVRYLRADPSDESAWIASGSYIWHFARDGQLLGSAMAVEPIQDVAIGWDRTVWLLGQHTVHHTEAPEAGARDIDVFAIDGLPDVPTRLALDLLHRSVWVAGGKLLSRIDLDRAQPRLDLPLPADTQELIVEPQSGLLWVLTPTTISSYLSSGLRKFSLVLAKSRIVGAYAFSPDPSGNFLWVLHQKGVSRIGLKDGSSAAVGNPRDSARFTAISVPQFSAVPTLTLRSPSSSAVLAAGTEFSFEAGVRCGNGECSLAPEYFESMDLRAALNGESLGVLAVDPSSHLAHSVVGAVPVNFGKVQLTAEVKDAFGRSADPLLVEFNAKPQSKATDTVKVFAVDATPLAGGNQGSVSANGAGASGSNGASSGVPTTVPSAASPTVGAISEAWRGAFARLPLTFESNLGQHNSSVDYVVRGHGYRLFLAKGETVLRMRGKRTGSGAGPSSGKLSAVVSGRHDDVLRVRFPGANLRPQAIPEQPLVTRSHYFSGPSSAQWHTDVPHYGRIRYVEVFKGIDQVYYGQEGKLEYDWIVKPGADPKAILQEFAGATGLTIDSNGDLQIDMPSGRLTQHKPVAYQDVNGTHQNVDAQYVVSSGNRVAIAVSGYDKQRPLIIDPVLSYASYLGGSGEDYATAVAVDPSGNVYLSGITLSADFPASSGSVEASTTTAFVAKLDPSGTQLIYTAFFSLGSTNALTRTASGVINSIAVDAQGNAYIAGMAFDGFPTTSGSAQPTAASYNWVAGSCNGCGPATFARPNGFVAKLNPQGDGFVYSTFLDGGYGPVNGMSGDYGLWTQVRAITLGPDGSVYAVGETDSTAFPTTTGAYQTIKKAAYSHVVNGFVTKLSPTGDRWVYSTLLGGSGPYPDYQGSRIKSPFSDVTSGDVAFAVAVDANGSAYVGGSTFSPDFPVTATGFQTTRKGVIDGFISKLSPDGTTLQYSSLIGGGDGYTASFAQIKQKAWSGVDYVSGLALDASNNVYVAGTTNSPNFSTASPFQSSLPTASNYLTINGIDVIRTNAFVAKIDLTRSGAAQLVYSTYFGGSGCLVGDCASSSSYPLYLDKATALAVDASGNATIVGFTGSQDIRVGVNLNGAKFPYLQSAIASGVLQARSPFIAHFDASGALGYSMPLATSAAGQNAYIYPLNGAEGGSMATAIALDSSGAAYVVGAITDDTMYSSSGTFQPSKNSNLTGGDIPARDAFVLKLADDGPAQISIATSPNPSTAEQQVQISVNVSGGAKLLTGTWSWCDGNQCQVIPAGSFLGGTTLIAHAYLTVGQHNLTARYSGDGINPSLVSAVRVHTVNPALADTPLYANRPQSSVSLAATPTAVAAGQPVTLTASVTRDTADCPVAGPVAFYDGSALLAVQTNSTLTTSFTTTGAHVLKATYSGDSCSKASQSPTVTVTVDALNPTAILAAPVTGAKYQAGTSVPLLAYPSVAAGRTVSSVKFLVNGQPISTVTASPYQAVWNPTSGSATGVQPGVYTITAVVTDSTGAVGASLAASVTVVSSTVQGQGITYLLNDVTGSPVAATDEAGAVVWKESYRPYGERLQNQTASSSNRQFFHGKPYDSATGLQYFGARYYDPVVGRFMGTDPAGYTEGDWHSFNRYAFSNNNPYHYTDPDGNSVFDLVFLAVDVYQLGRAIYTGHGAGEASINLGISVVGVISPLPGVGLEIKAARAAGEAAEAVRAAGHAAEEIRVVEKSAEAAKAVKSGGESAKAARGREAHKNYENALGEGYEFNQALPSGKRPDAIDAENRIVRELKPDNPRAVRRGERQVEGYKKELEQMTGEKWTSHVDTYRQ